MTTNNSVNAGGLSSIAETTAGSSTVKLITPNSLGGSIYGTWMMRLNVFRPDELITLGNGRAYVRLPNFLNNTYFVYAAAQCVTAGSSSTTLIQIRSASWSDLLTTRINIESGETDSTTATTQPVVDTGNNGMTSPDRIYIDVDQRSSTSRGLIINLGFSNEQI